MKGKRFRYKVNRSTTEGSRGFTLPEVMAAVLCFMLAALPLLSIFEQAGRAAYDVTEDSHRTFALQQILESAKARGLEDLLEAEESGTLPTDEDRESLIINGRQCSYSLSLSDYPAGSSDRGEQAEGEASDGRKGLMLLTAVIYWGSGQQQSESLSTAVSDRIHYTE